ncbi:MAG: DUF4342 domain-containing protein [Phormidesmis sp. RL_2_1]|nr:DUF4342 domain-containing protein [Phormidesmis sp. RL_2_1]
MNPESTDTTPVSDTVTPNSTTDTDADRTVTVEEVKISGDALVSQIKALIQRGNIRRIIIKNEEGHTLIEIPLTVGVIGGTIGAALFPVVAAVGVIGAMVAHLTVVIERQASD